MSDQIASPMRKDTWERLLDALNHAEDDGARCAAVYAACVDLVGPCLLTISRFDRERSTLQRLWSSDPEAYPVGGSKFKADTPWTRTVLQRGEVFVGEGDAALAEAFDDIDRIRGLGLRSALNVPLIRQRRCVGTFNVLRAVERWLDDEIVDIRLLAELTSPSVRPR